MFSAEAKLSYFVGVDIGTTSTKAIVFNRAGVICGFANQGYALAAPQPGWAEQDPVAIYTAVLTALQAAISEATVPPAAITGIGFSGAMHSLIAVDAADRLLTASITWADTRATAQAEQLKREGVGQVIYQRTGVPIHPMSPLVKLLWLRDQAPDVFYGAGRFISAKEYVLYRLCGRFVVDYAIASATGLLNVHQLTWDEVALERVGLGPAVFSELVPLTHIVRGIDPSVASRLGVLPEVPLVVGGSDGALAILGSGAFDPERTAVTIGTSSALRQVVNRPLLDPQGQTFCYALSPQHWMVGGASNNGGIALQWFRDRFCQAEVAQAKRLGIDVYDLLLQQAMMVPPGAEGLLFLPFLSGERAPYWNANARGTFFGLALHHDRPHLIRAVLEGILLAVYSIAQVLETLTGKQTTWLAGGGFARSAFWCQLLADVCGCEVLVPAVTEASGFGAAALVMVALGHLESLEAVQSLVRLGDRYTPDWSSHQHYRELFHLYQQVYSKLVPEFDAIPAFQKDRPIHE